MELCAEATGRSIDVHDLARQRTRRSGSSSRSRSISALETTAPRRGRDRSRDVPSHGPRADDAVPSTPDERDPTALPWPCASRAVPAPEPRAEHRHTTQRRAYARDVSAPTSRAPKLSVRAASIPIMDQEREELRGRCIHSCPVSALRRIGVHLLPTGHRPHFTAVIASDDEDELRRLLACLGPPRENHDGTLAPPGQRRRS